MDTPPALPVTERRIRKIRRLRKPVDPPHAPKPRTSLKTIIVIVLVSVLVFFISTNRYLVNEFKNLALNQYQLYLHGRIDYCKERFDYQRLTKALRHQIVNQDAALNGIEAAFLQHENVTALAMYGPQGVGKTMTLNIIQSNFQWHLNIQQYVWSVIDAEQVHVVSLHRLVAGLSTCGQNGIFIDNIPTTSVSVIEGFHAKLLNRCNEESLKCIVIYVFQCDEPCSMAALKFNDTKVIQLRSFDSIDLMECLALESTRLNVELTTEQQKDLLASVQVERNGCKTVAAKIARYTEQNEW